MVLMLMCVVVLMMFVMLGFVVWDEDRLVEIVFFLCVMMVVIFVLVFVLMSWLIVWMLVGVLRMF